MPSGQASGKSGKAAAGPTWSPLRSRDGSRPAAGWHPAIRRAGDLRARFDGAAQRRVAGRHAGQDASPASDVSCTRPLPPAARFAASLHAGAALHCRSQSSCFCSTETRPASSPRSPAPPPPPPRPTRGDSRTLVPPPQLPPFPTAAFSVPHHLQLVWRPQLLERVPVQFRLQRFLHRITPPALHRVASTPSFNAKKRFITARNASP